MFRILLHFNFFYNANVKIFTESLSKILIYVTITLMSTYFHLYPWYVSPRKLTKSCLIFYTRFPCDIA